MNVQLLDSMSKMLFGCYLEYFMKRHLDMCLLNVIAVFVFQMHGILHHNDFFLIVYGYLVAEFYQFFTYQVSFAYYVVGLMRFVRIFLVNVGDLMCFA